MLLVPVMAAVAVRKKVVSIGHFSPSFYLQSLQFFLFIRLNQELLYESIALKIRKNRTEPNELDELKYSKSLNQTTSYAHWHAFLYLHAQTRIKTFIYLSHFNSEKKTELNELNELEYLKTPSQMSLLKHISKYLFIYRIWNEQGRIHGNPVADGWAGAVMRRPLGIKQGH